MPQSISPRNGTADIAAAVPTQRIVTSEAAVNRVRDHRGRFVRPGGPEATEDLSDSLPPENSQRANRRPDARQPQAGQQPARQPVARQAATSGRSRAADRAERAARARVERAAARAQADSGTAERTAVEPRTPEQTDPMEDRAKRFRAAVSELAGERQGASGTGHGGPLVRARATRSEIPGEPSHSQIPAELPPSQAPTGRSRRSRPARTAPNAGGPQQRPRKQPPRTEVMDGWASSPVETPHGHFVHVRSPLSELTFERLELTGALPDLTAALGAIPGGLGAEVGESFVFAGQEWTSGDAHATGTPIGVQLAMEQRGLGVADNGLHGAGAGRRHAPV